MMRATQDEYSDIRNQLYRQTLTFFPSAPPNPRYTWLGHYMAHLISINVPQMSHNKLP